MKTSFPFRFPQRLKSFRLETFGIILSPVLHSYFFTIEIDGAESSYFYQAYS